jgi:hypothetical protein
MIIEGEKVNEYGMSLNILVESYANNTIRILGCSMGRSLIILIDSESTHYFIDELVVNKIKVVIRKTIILAVTMVNKSIMRCNLHNPLFTWFI